MKLIKAIKKVKGKIYWFLLIAYWKINGYYDDSGYEGCFTINAIP